MERDIHTVKKNTPVDEIIRFIDSNEIEHVAVMTIVVIS
jgi:CBS domain-containing protein